VFTCIHIYERRYFQGSAFIFFRKQLAEMGLFSDRKELEYIKSLDQLTSSWLVTK